MNKQGHFSDEALFLSIKSGDTYALKLLFSKYYENLCYFVFTIVNDSDVSKEIVSDMFLGIWEKRENINIKFKVKNYLYTAAKNRAINYLHKKKIITEPIHFHQNSGNVLESNPEEMLIFEEKKKEIENLVDQLPERRKLIFQMKRFDGFTFKEIADILSISVQTVRNQMVKAVKYLAEQYPKLK